MKPYNTPNAGKKEEVKRMFDNIAPTYDRLNHILSLSIDRVWRRRVMRIVRRAHPRQILDLATGTGDLAILMAKRIPQAQVMGVDLSEKMLAEASEKVRRQGLDDHVVLYQGDAERLDLGDGAVDVVTVAFGVRNFGNMEAGLSEALRVLRGGAGLWFWSSRRRAIGLCGGPIRSIRTRYCARSGVWSRTTSRLTATCLPRSRSSPRPRGFWRSCGVLDLRIAAAVRSVWA